jgi:murein DD-endopeptidase MepM/ murein hydrolase activator NlpD
MTLGEPTSSRGSNLGCAVRALLLLLGLLVVVLLGLMLFRAGGEPEVSIEPERPGIGARTPVAVRLKGGSRGLGPVRVELVQGERVVLLGEEQFDPQPAWKLWGGGEEETTLDLEVGRETVEGLQQGDATLRVTAERPGAWLRSPDPVVEEVTLPVRLTPPALGVRSDKHYVAQGGAELVVYTVGESEVRSGVQAGEHWFPGYPLPGGANNERFALFAIPYDMADGGNVKLVAEDEVGNRAEAAFLDRFQPRPPLEGRIELSESFMSRVVPEIISNTPGFPDQGGLLENYLYINGELRERNRARVAQLADGTQEEFLWTERFLPMPNAAVMAGFATHREYFLDGEKVDEAFHLGYDLASTQRDVIPAANSGVVVVAEYFGIYGNAVVIDHGYGLMSLYGHLSSIGVEEGDRVERGQEIGRTGQTGLAGGDHLHYGMFLHGQAVEPKEWWDSHWLQDRISRKLGAAWEFEG